jgi:ribosomal protein S17
MDITQKNKYQVHVHDIIILMEVFVIIAQCMIISTTKAARLHIALSATSNYLKCQYRTLWRDRE